MGLKRKSLVFIIIALNGCIYEGGNVGTILSFSSNINSNIILEMTDSLNNKNTFNVPDSLEYLINFDDYNHLDYRVYYFNNLPREIYFITFQGNVSIRYIYSFEEEKWVSRKTGIDTNQSMRIKKRVISDILSKVVEEAKLIQYQDKDIYINLENCGTKIMCEND